MSAEAGTGSRPVSPGDVPDTPLNRAKDPRTPAETLDALSREGDPRVRRAVAANPMAPESADLRLAADPVARVRAAVGCKIAVVGLGETATSPKWRTGFAILEGLAADPEPEVRRVLAEAVAGGGRVPEAIVSGMLRDSDPEVPRILIHHPGFMDERRVARLLESDLPGAVQQAIASRPAVSDALALVIVRKGAPGAVRALLENPGADISEATMAEILDRAPRMTEWHDALVHRAGLPERFIVRIARFVPPALVTALKTRAGLRPQVLGAIDRVTLARFELSRQKTTRDAAFGIGPCAAAAIATDGSWESAEDRAVSMHEAGELDDAAIQAAIDMGEADFVIQALALRSGAPLAMANRIMMAGGGKAVTALCWRADLPLKMAIQVQERIAGIPKDGVIRGEGPYYPLLESEMSRLLFHYQV